ncbi:MAG: lysine-sensitive aspartokinase 3 [Termitinemataceae bacterium]|nr:MAG: lysine-sensitive aspartokinase 3 [Termitinemataceae bacterium]
MIVMKFGGSSVANAQRLRSIEKIIHSRLSLKPVLVLSAMGDTTDHLLQAADDALKIGAAGVEKSIEKLTENHISCLTELGLAQSGMPIIAPLLKELGSLLTGISLTKELTGRTKDYLVSFGERLSVRLAALYFKECGINALPLDAWDAGFISDSNASNAEILPESSKLIPQKILPLVENGVVPVVTGFIAKDSGGIITTLGRGGSDLSATMIAAFCMAEEVQVWKDVDGILSADPRIVPNAHTVDAVSYEEAAELAYYGAQVLHPRAMQPCIKTGTIVRVKNSYNPESPGSIITKTVPFTGNFVRSVTTRSNVTLVHIVSSRMLGQHGFLAEVFAIFARYGISVDMVATSEVSVSITLDSVYDLTAAAEELSRIAGVEIKNKKAIVTVVGNLEKPPQLLEKISSVCAKLDIKIQMISQGASKVNISFIVEESQAKQVVQALHKKFFD